MLFWGVQVWPLTRFFPGFLYRQINSGKSIVVLFCSYKQINLSQSWTFEALFELAWFPSRAFNLALYVAFVRANQSRQINDPSFSFSFVPISKLICLDIRLLKRIFELTLLTSRALNLAWYVAFCTSKSIQLNQ